MASWKEFAAQAPEIASAGQELIFQFGRGLAYLATIRPDGGPRVHPISPLFLGETLVVAVGGSKMHDLLRDSRFALHTPGPKDTDDEFYLTGVASPVFARLQVESVSDYGSPVTPHANPRAFELDIERALLATYRPRAEGNTWPPKYDRWRDDARVPTARPPSNVPVPHEGLRWHEFAEAEPTLAARGRELIRQFGIGLGYMATVRPDGGPRLHPFCPTFSGDGLYGLILGESPKCRDLLRDRRIAVHAFQPADRDDEFCISGTAELIEDRELEDQVRASAIADGMTSTEDETLFEFRVDRAFLATYKPRAEPNSKPPTYTSWRLRQSAPAKSRS